MQKPAPAQASRARGDARPSVVQKVLQSPGQPLDQSTQTFFESGFQHDFSAVRVHADAPAAAAARSMAARAFTSRNEIVFGAGQFAPHTPKGRWLLGHELAHVAQAKDGPGSSSTSQIERDASRAATGVLRGEAVRLEARHDGAQLHLFGEPENVPEMTYISTQGNAGFLNQAAEFHEGWRLPVRRIASVEQMIDHLGQRDAPIGRIRFVTHAVEVGVFSSLFTGEPLESLTGERLSAYAQSDAAGLALDTSMPGLDFGGVLQFVDAIRRSSPNAAALLTPFGLQQAGEPAGQLDAFFRRVVQRAILRQNRTRQNAREWDPVIEAVTVVIPHVAALAAREFPGVSTATVLALQPAIEAAFVTLGITVQLTIPAGQTAHAGAAVRATKAGFRRKLDAVRRRFNINSWIDIRGCNAGGNPAYLQSFARFFGREGDFPHVSGPDWFQIFPTLALRTIFNDAEFNEAAARAEVLFALDRWSPLTGARQQMELLRAFYRARVGGQQPSDPLLAGLPTTAADRAAVAQLLEPGTAGTAIAQRELDRLSAPEAELRYYLDSALVLPVLRGDHFEMVVRAQLLNAAIDRWLASQWAGQAPGLAALQARPPNADITRRVQALIPTPDSRAEMVFPPDPRFWEHIIQI